MGTAHAFSEDTPLAAVFPVNALDALPTDEAQPSTSSDDLADHADLDLIGDRSEGNPTGRFFNHTFIVLALSIITHCVLQTLLT